MDGCKILHIIHLNVGCQQPQHSAVDHKGIKKYEQGGFVYVSEWSSRGLESHSDASGSNGLT